VNSLGTFGLAKKNIKNKPARSYGMMVLTGVLCFILFFGSFMIYSLKRGISSLSDRMGADIIVVPEGYDSKVTGAILRGEPNSFFFDRAVEDRVKAVEGVEKTAPQLFLATLSASCCSFPIQIIGIDFNSDFTVAPWLEKQVGLPLKEGEIIVGNNVEGNIHAEVKFFSRPFKIKGRLAKTGMGFDNTVFMSIEQAKALAVEFEKTLQTPDAGRENMISSVMVRVKRGESPEEVLKRLRAEFKSDGIYPILSKQMMSEVSKNMEGMLIYVYVLIGLLWLLAFCVLTLVYSVAIKERKREFAMLRILGTTKSKLRNIFISEVFIINLIGASIGTAFGVICALLFAPAVGNSLKMPFLQPSAVVLIMLAAASILAGTFLGPLSSLFSLIKMSAAEPALLLREND